MSDLDVYDSDYLRALRYKRLSELEKTRAIVDDLEFRTSTRRTEYELQRTKLDILNRLSQHYSDLNPLLRDMGDHVVELKAYLKSVYDADLLGDSMLQEIATEHCLMYTVRLMESLADASTYSGKGTYGVLELATSTINMFSQRAYAVPLLQRAGAISSLTRLLSPLFPAPCVVHCCNALGNLASNLECRLSIRAGGALQALVRLLRSDVQDSVQAASAAAISLLAARDVVVQDSVRNLRGIDLLVDLLASDDLYVAEVARYCLLSVRSGNVKNQAEIITAMRSNPLLAIDIRKMNAASELLHFEERTPSKAPLLLTSSFDREASSVRRSSAAVRSLLAEMDTTTSKLHTTSRPKSAGLGSTMRSTLKSSGGRYAAPDDWKISTRLTDSDSYLRKRHISGMTCDELCRLLESAGLDYLDLRQIRAQHIDGRTLLDMSETEMLYDLMLTRSRARKVTEIQRATRLFDRMATLAGQGKLTEMEIRLYLAGQGATTNEITKTLRLIKTLVKPDLNDYFTFWDFVLGYDWVKQALHIVGIPA